MSTDIKAVLAEREKTHGSFVLHSFCTQELKGVVGQHLMEQGRRLDPDMQEAVDMICHKLGRIVAGNSSHVDHWLDIAGYATLIADRLTNEPLDPF